MQRVQDDHALLDPLLVKVIHPFHVSVEKLCEGLRDLLVPQLKQRDYSRIKGIRHLDIRST